MTTAGGTASRAARTAATTMPAASRRPASSGTAEAAMISAAPISVRCVPMSGMVMRAGTKVPMMLPAVESAKIRPATRPASSTPVAASRMANGVTMPSSTTGGANSASDAANEPTTAPVDSVSMPLMERSRNGRATKGIAATQTAAARTIVGQELRRGMAVGQAAAEPVADGERGEDQPDDVRPHHRRRAVVRGQQPGRADLRRHRADAGEEDEDGERYGVCLPGHWRESTEASRGPHRDRRRSLRAEPRPAPGVVRLDNGLLSD